MQINKPLRIAFIIIAWLTLSGRSCTEATITTGVDSAQKISATAGNFEGGLDDNDQFGSAAANIGDLNADGVIDLAVGAPLDDDGGTDRGAVWILNLNTNATVKSYQKISDTEGNFSGSLDYGDSFGCSVENANDLDGDGVIDLAVGAYGDDDGGDAGQGFVRQVVQREHRHGHENIVCQFVDVAFQERADHELGAIGDRCGVCRGCRSAGD